MHGHGQGFLEVHFSAIQSAWLERLLSASCESSGHEPSSDRRSRGRARETLREEKMDMRRMIGLTLVAAVASVLPVGISAAGASTKFAYTSRLPTRRIWSSASRRRESEEIRVGGSTSLAATAVSIPCSAGQCIGSLHNLSAPPVTFAPDPERGRVTSTLSPDIPTSPAPLRVLGDVSRRVHGCDAHEPHDRPRLPAGFDQSRLDNVEDARPARERSGHLSLVRSRVVRADQARLRGFRGGLSPVPVGNSQSPS